MLKKMRKLSHGSFEYKKLHISSNRFISRYLSRGKRHTVCEQALVLGGKARRGTREPPKDRGPLSRRSSDTSSNFINSTAKANLERLYHNAVTSKLSDDDDVTTSSLQELHKLQKQVQKVN
jgi:hypothetical protein